MEELGTNFMTLKLI